MSAGGEELRLTLVRLRVAMADAGLSDGQVERLLAIDCGSWPAVRDGSAPAPLTRTQERRARLATEFVGQLARLLGHDAAASGWLTRATDDLDGASPLDWAAEDVEHLHAMVACLRRGDA